MCWCCPVALQNRIIVSFTYVICSKPAEPLRYPAGQYISKQSVITHCSFRCYFSPINRTQSFSFTKVTEMRYILDFISHSVVAGVATPCLFKKEWLKKPQINWRFGPLSWLQSLYWFSTLTKHCLWIKVPQISTKQADHTIRVILFSPLFTWSHRAQGYKDKGKAGLSGGIKSDWWEL